MLTTSSPFLHGWKMLVWKILPCLRREYRFKPTSVDWRRFIVLLRWCVQTLAVWTVRGPIGRMPWIALVWTESSARKCLWILAVVNSFRRATTWLYRVLERQRKISWSRATNQVQSWGKRPVSKETMKLELDPGKVGEEVVQEEEPGEQGFVLDQTTGLYYHASSGFYHDPTAGWYYNSRDGMYYKFEGGMYTPLVSLFSDVVFPEILADRCPDGARSVGTALNCGKSVGMVAMLGDDLSQTSFPPWHYDHGRCMYWYYDPKSAAYYMYGPSFAAVGDSAGGQDLASGETDFQWNRGPASSKTVDEPQAASKWIEETLMEMYLQGYQSISAVSGDEVPKITSEDTSDRSQSPQKATSDIFLIEPGTRTQESFETYDVEGTSWHADSPTGPDDDVSEGLEEGEWVPDEGEWLGTGSAGVQMDGSFEHHAQAEQDEGKGADTLVRLENDQDYGETESEAEGGQRVLSSSHASSRLSNTGLDQISPSADGFVDNPDFNAEASGRQGPEEQWQAQYGQVVQNSRNLIQLRGVVDLWDWLIVAEGQAQTRKKCSVRLVGRFASSRSKLHPSLSSSGGLIRTSKVCGAEYEFVRVSSGKVYRLRRPSAKQLASVTAYDSANPTVDWGFPTLGLSNGSKEETAVVPDTIKVTTEQVVSKPFIPNLGHWLFQTVANKKRRVPYTAETLLIVSSTKKTQYEGKHKYRDRAAERRTLHKGFGNGPGQKDLPVNEIEKLEADFATGMVGALESAFSVPPLGNDNKGKTMLEGMGWKEGQALGVANKGLVCPIQASGNMGRAGLGWK